MLVYAFKLTFLATFALALGLSEQADESLEGTSLAFQWGLISLNTLLGVCLETRALTYVLSRKHLMKYEPRKMPKIVAVACGWAMSYLVTNQVLRTFFS